VPSQGGPAWIELTSDHFTIWTDSTPAHARQLVREMEHLRQVVLGVAFSELPTEGRCFVIALRDANEVRAFIPEGFLAFAWPPHGNPLREPMILIAADADDAENSHILTHELTHVISHGLIHEQPHWFAEGLAGFFETTHLDPDRAIVDVGEPPDMMVKSLGRRHLASISRVFECDDLSCMDSNFYVTTWALFTYLENVHPLELARYEQRLTELPSAEQEHAWAEVFPDLPPSQLDQDLPHWFAYGSHKVWHFSAKLHESPVEQRSLTDGDVYATRALIRYLFDQHHASRELVAALASDPTNVIARLVESVLKNSVDPTIAREVVKVHPDDWRAWSLLAIALAHGDEALGARDKACALATRNPAAVPPQGFCPNTHATSEPAR
jgi:hypothetical protein